MGKPRWLECFAFYLRFFFICWKPKNNIHYEQIKFYLFVFKELLSQVVDLEQMPLEIRLMTCFIREQRNRETCHFLLHSTMLFFFFLGELHVLSFPNILADIC